VHLQHSGTSSAGPRNLQTEFDDLALWKMDQLQADVDGKIKLLQFILGRTHRITKGDNIPGSTNSETLSLCTLP